MDKPLTVYAEIDDLDLIAAFKATLEREQRTMKAVTERALRDYIVKSQIEASKTDPRKKVAA